MTSEVYETPRKRSLLPHCLLPKLPEHAPTKTGPGIHQLGTGQE